MTKQFGKAKLCFYPRMQECEEDVAASCGLGGSVIRFLEEYKREIEAVYGDVLAVIGAEVNCLDVLVAGSSLLEEDLIQVLQPETYPSGLRRHVFLMFVRPLAALARTLRRAHPDEDTYEIMWFSLGMVFLQGLHAYVESDERDMQSKTEELSEMLESQVGGWLSDILGSDLPEQ